MFRKLVLFMLLSGYACAQSPPTPDGYKKPVDENYPPVFIHPIGTDQYWEHRYDTYVPAKKYPLNYPNIHPQIGFRLVHVDGKTFNVIPNGDYRFPTISIGHVEIPASDRWVWTAFATTDGKVVRGDYFLPLGAKYDEKYFEYFFDKKTRMPIYRYLAINYTECDFVFPVLGHLYLVKKTDEKQMNDNEANKASLLENTTKEKLLAEYKSAKLLPDDAEDIVLQGKISTYLFPLNILDPENDAIPYSGFLNSVRIRVVVFHEKELNNDASTQIKHKMKILLSTHNDSAEELDKMDKRKDIRDPSPLKDYRQYTLGDIVKVGDVGYRLVNIVPPKKGNTALGMQREYYVCGWIEIDAKPIPLDKNGEPIESN